MRPGRTSVDERLLEQKVVTLRESAWIPAPTVTRLRDVVTRYLDGERNLATEVEQLATAVADSAHALGHTPERMLIAVRELWGEFTRSQHERLQLAALYDRLVRRTIDRYYHT
jgi:hypothetical protein